ncbi:discoidin domain receptor, putative [Pediculus humanus corporis]|uniref:Discoidin domain receptor, putative n=1 Tax=Pediculus humanus subsp. corporis TaxID=121224 RepID=E0W014_PEDHC|nr:discoidin domain receptor, putative [Pediculus humanus corporis]EEB18970.1 discoidin domain receptor, putative [Pediculus humanus corporis]
MCVLLSVKITFVSGKSVRTEINGGAWCPKEPTTAEPKEWLEINLHTVHVITSTETQGRFGNGQGMEYTEAYILEYWRPKIGKWVRYRDVNGTEVIQGNSNTYIEAKRELDPPIWASKIRFLPYSHHKRTVCMRVEIYGCHWNDGIVSYSMPQGDVRGTGWEFYDATYDGYWDGELRRGLGLLTDGKIGPENFRLGYYNYGKSKSGGWVGWKNETRNNQPIEIKFEFEQVREFTAIHIYCNNQFTKDVQVFSEAKIVFSVEGKYFPGEPITYTHMEDRIFEHSRNVSIKLHHRVGKFVKLQLYFAAKWIMISEVTFDSEIFLILDVAHGNFTPESPPHPEIPVQSDIYVENNNKIQNNNLARETPISTTNQEDSTYMAVIIGVLMAVIVLLAVAIFLIVSRHRQRKCFASPLGNKSALPGNRNHQHVSLENSCGTVEKSGTVNSYGEKVLDDNYNQSNRCVGTIASTTMSTLPPSSNPEHILLKLDDYQEPYQAYSTVVMEMRDFLNKGDNFTHSGEDEKNIEIYILCVHNYDYAVPELGTMPLLAHDSTLQHSIISNGNYDKDTMFSKVSSTNNSKSGGSEEGKGKKQEVLTALRRRLEHTAVPEFPRHRLRMLSKLSDGWDFRIWFNNFARLDFHRDIKILAALEDPNIARVLGICSHEEPLCVIMEYLDHGDLNQFLRNHVPTDGGRTLTLGVKTLSFNCLLYIATQIASGMRYLETLNFVHRDLATRNCLIGKAYQVKISDFGTDNELYAGDYYKVDGSLALPIRWMAWESMYMGKYTTKSDVWSFAVTLWEILNFGRRIPYETMNDPRVVENVSHLHLNDGQFVYLPRPPTSTKDLYDLMCECWRRNDHERPSFREIHLFLQRKNLGYAPSS